GSCWASAEYTSQPLVSLPALELSKTIIAPGIQNGASGAAHEPARFRSPQRQKVEPVGFVLVGCPPLVPGPGSRSITHHVDPQGRAHKGSTHNSRLPGPLIFRTRKDATLRLLTLRILDPQHSYCCFSN